MRSSRETRARRRLGWMGWLLALCLLAPAAANWASLSLQPAQPSTLICAQSRSSSGDCASTATDDVAYVPCAEPPVPALAFMPAPVLTVLRQSSLVLSPLTPPPPTA